jgi:hypothetical protein
MRQSDAADDVGDCRHGTGTREADEPFHLTATRFTLRAECRSKRH